MTAFAKVTDFECAESWGCHRVATQFHSSYRTKNKPTITEAFAAGLVCNVHAGAVKRKKQGRYASSYRDEELFPIATLGSHFDEAKAAYLKARADAATERQAEAERQRAENNEVARARFAQAWVERSTEAPFIVTRGTDRTPYGDKFIDGYVIKMEGDTDRWNTNTVEVEQDGKAPSTINIRSSSRMSPAQARALAQALMLAANLGDERDITNGAG